MPELAASQLFGHVKGAFANAVIDSVGIVQEADRGTLFLDQLSDAPANVQDMLLTLLEVEEIKPVGIRVTFPKNKISELTNYPYQNVLVQPWLKGYKQNALTLQQWRYYDIEPRR